MTKIDNVALVRKKVDEEVYPVSSHRAQVNDRICENLTNRRLTSCQFLKIISLRVSLLVY